MLRTLVCKMKFLQLGKYANWCLVLFLITLLHAKSNAQCIADFTYSVDSATITATFTNKAIGDSLAYFWSFGDGVSSTDTNPTYRFTKNGWYFVCLNIVNNDTTCVDVKCEFVRINKFTPAPCSVSYSYIYDSLDSKKVYFTDETIGDSSNTVLWVIGDSSISVTKRFALQFSTVGKYKICLLSSGINCADSVCKIVEILDFLPACKSNFNVQLFSDSGNNAKRIASFTNTSTGDNILGYAWNFGDGSTSSKASPFHYYALDGEYTVCLKAYIDLLCADTSCQVVSVKTITNSVEEKEAFSLSTIYPNPFESELKIEINFTSNSIIYVTLFDLVGNNILNTKKIVGIGRQKIELTIPESLSTGLYFLALSNNEKQQVVKVFKQ